MENDLDISTHITTSS